MYKKMIASALALTALAGCSHNVENPVDYVTYRNEPLVDQVKDGMTKQRATELGGPASSDITLDGNRGTCNNYVLNHKGKEQPYYVAFDINDRVVSKGFMTCEQHQHNEREKRKS
jgi:osmotically inducible lipoprotein OsmE